MYSKVLTFSATALNTGTLQSGVVSFTIVPSGMIGSYRTDTYYPRGMYFKNATGGTISFVLLSSDKDMNNYQNGIGTYNAIPVANGDTWTNLISPLPITKHMLVQASGSITAALNVSFAPYTMLTAS